ncbi:MAG: radical SAM protein [Desulfobacteraceae bacterium]
MALSNDKKSPILENRKNLSDVVPLDTPYSVTLHLTTRCNSRCIFCNLHSSTSPKFIAEDMKYKLAIKVIDQLKKHSKKIKTIHISGLGEPLLNTDIAQIVRYAKNAKITENIDLITNGILLTKKRVDALLDAGLDTFRISVNGLTSQDYLKYTESTVCYDKYIRQLEYLYNNRKNATIYIKIMDFMVNTSENKKKFEKIFTPIADDISIEYYNDLPGEYKAKGKLLPSKLTQRGEILNPVKCCPYPFYSLTVLPNGDIAPCPNHKRIISNINDLQDKETILWNSPALNSFRIEMLKKSLSGIDGICRTCVFATSSCAYNANNIDGERKRLLEYYKPSHQ